MKIEIESLGSVQTIYVGFRFYLQHAQVVRDVEAEEQELDKIQELVKVKRAQNRCRKCLHKINSKTNDASLLTIFIRKTFVMKF